MKHTNQFSGKAVQHGLGRTNTGSLQSIWIELPAYCNLACSYCYACGGEIKDTTEWLTRADYIRVLDEAQKLGVDSVGVPGAGEPFVKKNHDLTMWFLHQCADRGFYVTLFTTGEFITEELARELYDLPVEIMLKGNTLDPDYQDRFVSNPAKGQIIHGYGEKRNQAIEILMKVGFNNREEAQRFGRESRMAIVTSIMTDEEEGGLSNIDQVADIYRFCRDRNIIADIDTILKRGRAMECGLTSGDKRIMEVLQGLRKIAIEEYGDKEAALSSTYVETVCDRYHHHLYVDVQGRIRPCIGAMDVNLGNIKQKTLQEAWDSKERRIIRERKFAGPCASCANFQEGKCNSCLGRRTPASGEKALTNEHLLRDNAVQTTGCPLRRACS